MAVLRTSCGQDVPELKALWKLAFGDEDAYIDHFFEGYYAPERVLVLEEGGTVHAMTAWFDTVLETADGNQWRAAYLYAVATHPDCRGKGLAGQLLAYADRYLGGEQGFDCVTTVPARPDLHVFFGRNGFRECFELTQRTLLPEQIPVSDIAVELQPISAQEYGTLREQLLAGRPHISYAPAALDYQSGCCALSGGGLFWGDTSEGPVCLCAERTGAELVVIKELLGSVPAVQVAQGDLLRVLPAEKWLIREPVGVGTAERWKFAMLKWLNSEQERNWDWKSVAYLGLAFD